VDGCNDMVTGGPSEARGLAGRLAILAVWAAVAGYLAWHHVFWRDEVRALSLALGGDTWGAMLRGVQGEGHPALWYVLLRGAHELVPVRQVLPVMAGLIGVAMATVFAWRAPFALWRIALVLFGAFALYEYTVSARNYGMSALLLFVFADRYARHRDTGVVLGLLLALLCNTNVHSAFIAAGLLLFWAIELLCEDGWRWTSRVRTWLVNTAIATIGAALCAVTVYPPANDASVAVHPGGIGLETIAIALLPTPAFGSLVPPFAQSWYLAIALVAFLLPIAFVGLIRAPAAFLSAIVVTVAFELFFALVYYGSYRHQALLLVYLITMYWLVALGRGGAWPAAWRGSGAMLARWTKVGGAAFAALLALQVLASVQRIVAVVRDTPESSARDLGRVLQARGLTQAILVADPDIMLEPMPYYATNRLYLLRNGRFGAVVPFTRRARLDLSLAEMQAEMRRLQAHYRVPIVAVLEHDLTLATPTRREEVNVWTFTTTPDQVRAFRAATTQIASLRRSTGDENYDVYLLR
jgi:hypothetical protein